MRKTHIQAVSYLRVSGVAQVKGDGFPRQRATILAYAKAHKIDVIDEYRDEGISGTKETADRPGLAMLIDRLRHNGVRLVLVERADRVARDLIVSEMILSQLRDAGVSVVEAESGNDLTAGDQDNPSAKLIRQILGVVSEYDKDSIVLKLRAARDRMRRETGRCEGKKPFGTRPGEQATLARIRQLRRKARKGKRKSYAKIAAMLNDEGRPTRHGRPWKPATVYTICNRKAP